MLNLCFSKFGGDSRKYLNIAEDVLVFVTQMDPTVGRLYGGDTNCASCVQLRGGRKMLTISEYLEVLAALQPDASHYMTSTPVRNQFL